MRLDKKTYVTLLDVLTSEIEDLKREVSHLNREVTRWHARSDACEWNLKVSSKENLESFKDIWGSGLLYGRTFVKSRS